MPSKYRGMNKSVTAQAEDVALYELHLYVAGQTGRDRLVERDMRRVLDQDFPGRYTLTVIDVLADPGQAERANISLTPALVYHGAAAPRRLVGDELRREQILWLLERAPIKPRVPGPDVRGGLSDLCPDGMILIDQDGHVIDCNAAGRDLLGLADRPASGEVFGRPLTDGRPIHVRLANGVPLELQVTECAWNGETAHLVVLRQPGGDGPHSTSADPAANDEMDKLADQNATHQSEMAALRQELERSYTDLSAFSRRVGHDIKAPALTIKGLLTALASQEADQLSADGKALLDAALNSSHRLIDLTDAMLEFARTTGPQDHETVDLNAVVGRVNTELGMAIEEAGAKVEVDELPIVLGSPMQLYQVFLNLLGNALHYRREDVAPKITVTVQRLDSSPIGPAYRIEIRDNCKGFDNAYAEKIFQPFERLVTQAKVPGQGLGLTTVKRIIEQHGGQVSASSSPGEGATFQFDLPRHVPN